jgi:hypothetical protein
MTTVEELPGMPGEPPFPEQFAPPGASTFREGYVLRFDDLDGGSWIGNFQKMGGSYYCTYLLLASGEVVVVAGGLGYVVTVSSRGLVRTFGDDVMHVVPLEGGNDFLIISNTDVERHNARERIWRSHRIAWDGIGRVEVSGSYLLGQARHFDESWHQFKLSLVTGTHEGGAYADV